MIGDAKSRRQQPGWNDLFASSRRNEIRLHRPFKPSRQAGCGISGSLKRPRPYGRRRLSGPEDVVPAPVLLRQNGFGVQRRKTRPPLSSSAVLAPETPPGPRQSAGRSAARPRAKERGVVAVSVESDVLKQADSLAKRRKVPRSALFNDALKALLATNPPTAKAG